MAFIADLIAKAERACESAAILLERGDIDGACNRSSRSTYAATCLTLTFNSVEPGPAPKMSSFRGRLRLYRRRNPTAFAGLQTRTPKAARRASAMDGASQSSDFDHASTLQKANDAGSRFRGNDVRVPAAKSAAGPGMTMWFVELQRKSGAAMRTFAESVS
ncbi:MAG: hypothetical protein ACREP2_00210 [Rhodanobacteraceae bacterium]